MSDKYLSVAEWKKFSKGRDLKDAALLKALEAFDKAERASADLRLKSLDELEKQAAALLKTAKSDKALATQMADMDKALKAQRKTIELAAKEAKAPADDDENEDSPALLTTMMVPLLRQLRKGEVVMPTLIALSSKEAALLISRRPISPGKRKLLNEALGLSSGLKYLMGECVFEEEAYTFVVPTQAAGLAKRLKQALLKQTGLRLKVRVRGEDGDDEDGDAEGTDPDNQADTSGKTARNADAVSATSQTASVTADQLTAAMNKLAPQIKAAITGTPALKASLLAPVAAFQEHLKAGRLDQAGAEFKRLAALLTSGASATPSTSSASSREAPAKQAQASATNLEQALGGWTRARTAALAQLLALEKAIRGMNDPEGDAAIILVKAIQANLTARPATRQAVAELERYITTDDIIDEAQGPNGFGLTVELRRPLLAALTGLRSALPA
ncbi:hypothetical protein EIP75_07415 [Aquabacterium soli]|uniref:Uncharacterized protein n=1 Tax=Aquabacterium soli TaxID=2493092 RepID=A0A3R8S8G8_9BURK|nr:hypothetical protein [Aquabacterium soli]RRS04808.1 hypothetical protein EIP75_07415 [Aquabacterium soli]